MNISVSERPGVYSGYAASSVVGSRAANRAIGLLVAGTALTVPTKFVTAAAARETLGSSSNIAKAIEVALLGGASACWVSPVLPKLQPGGGTAISIDCYSTAAAELRGKDVYLLISDAGATNVHRAIMTEVDAAAEERCERLYVYTEAGDADDIVVSAKAVHNKRCVLAGPLPTDESGANIPPLICSAAIAAAIASLEDPAVPLGGATLTGLYGGSKPLEDSVVDLLVLGGVTPLECRNGTIEILRGVTTAAPTEDDPEKTWHDLGTIMIADDVIKSLRDVLKVRFARAKNLPAVREAVANQVVILLEQKKTAGIIADYGEVHAEANAEDGSRCDVSLEFAVAHGMTHIVVSANILV